MTLILFLALQDTFEQKLDALLPKLRADDPDARTAAREDLRKAARADAKKAHDTLKTRAAKEADPDLKAAFEWVLANLWSLDDLKAEFDLPKDGLTLRAVRAGKFAIKLKLTNDTPVDLVILNSFNLQILDKAGKPVPHDRYIGSGERPEGCYVAAHPFLTVATGKSVELPFGIAVYNGRFATWQGWDLPAAGAYTLVMTNVFALDELSSLCPAACKIHGDASKIWHKALRGPRDFKADLVVREPTADEKTKQQQRDNDLAALIEAVRAGKIDMTEFEKKLPDDLSPDESQDVLKRALGLED